jgi:(p)ppGpp synthase/HD superfamily hydrolase
MSMSGDAATNAPLLGRRFADAMVYAWDVHRDQRRKGTSVPYVAHLLGVASLVLGDGGDEDEAIGALLHDAAEDQGGRKRLADIERRFGKRVARIVEGCSDSFDDPKPPWRERKEGFLRALRVAAPEVLRVALADKLYNIRTIVVDVGAGGPSVWGRFKAGPREQLWYFTELLGIFRRRSESAMVEQFAREVEALATLVSRDAAGR